MLTYILNDGSPLAYFVVLLIGASINGVAGCIIGSGKEGSTAGHFWIAFVFGVFGLCWIAGRRDEALSNYMGGAIDLLQARVAELEARLDHVSPETRGVSYARVPANTRMSSLSQGSIRASSKATGPDAEAEKKGYKKVCPKCKLDYSMKDEECARCHDRLSVVNELILPER